jgi:hypothetical protein
MFLGQSAKVRDTRPQLVDLNLVPPEYRPRPFPILTAGLGLLLVGCLLVVYGIFYAKTYADLEIDQLGIRVAQAQAVVEASTGDPAALAHQEQLRALRDDYKTLSQRQINWGDVFQVIGDVPPGVIVRTASQTGYGVTVSGSAVNQGTAAVYLDRLKNSGLFVDSAIQIGPASGPVAFESTSPTPVPTIAAPPPPKPAVAAVVPPVVAPVAPPPPVQQPVQQQPPPSQPKAVVIPTKTPTPHPTVAPTPSVFHTPTVIPSPTSAFDFVLKSTEQIPSSNPSAPNSDIKGSIVDGDGNLVTGFQVEIDSEGQPPWSSLSTTSAANGTFSFNVSHGKFKVFVIGGTSEPAIDLYTGSDGTPGTYGYVIVFQKTFSGAIPTGPSGTPSPTTTQTSTPTASPTPVAPGRNVASLGCSTAYLVKNGAPVAVPNNPDPALAIDGNLGTEWNSGTVPNSSTQVIWQWSLYATPVPGGCTAAGLADDEDKIDGFQLIPDQNPTGVTNHELWLYSDPECTINVKTDNSADFVWQQETAAGEILPLRIDPPLAVRCVIVRTISDPSVVAWEEIQIFQELPPPNGFPTLTPVPGSATASSTVTSTATGSATWTSTPTTTTTPTASMTPLPPVAGQNIAPFAPSVSSSGGTVDCPGPAGNGPSYPCSVIDNNSSSYWAPAAGSSDPQGVSISLVSNSYSTTDIITDIRVLVQSAGTGKATIYQLVTKKSDKSIVATCDFTSPPSGYPDSTQLSTQLQCPNVTPVAGVDSVSVLLYQDGVENGLSGIREVQVFKQTLGLSGGQCTSICTATPTPTNTPTAISTATITGVPLIANRQPISRGRGPGDAPQIVTPVQPSLQSTTVTPAAPVNISGAVDFTIILEVASGAGY